MNAEYMTG